MAGSGGAALLDDLRVEAEQHLDAVEAALAAAEGDVGSGAIDGLFRSFHSVKGLARIIDDAPLESLGHAAETLLAKARAGSQIGGDGRDALLAALDEARTLLGVLGSGRAPDPLVLEGLRVAGLRDGDGGRSAAEAMPAWPDQPWRVLTDDEDLLRALGELVDELLPGVGEAVFTGGAIDRDDADTLVRAFDRVGLAGLVAAMERLCAAEERERPDRFLDLSDALGRLGRLTDRTAPIPLGPAAAVGLAGAEAALPPAVAEGAAALPTAPGLEGASTSIRSALVGCDEAGRLAEAFLAVPDGSDRGAILAALAAEGAVVGAQWAVHDGRAGLAVLIATASRSAMEVLAAAVPAIPAAGVAEVSAATPTKLFAPPPPARVQDETQVRVPVGVLDRLFGRVGEFFSIGSWLNVLVYDGGIGDAIGRLGDAAAARAPEMAADVELLSRYHRDVSRIEAEVNRLVSLIHESTLGLRVIPLESLMSRFPRMVRETARDTGKAVRFEARTGGIRVDKGMSEMLADPLMHMLRNAVDHGIEPPNLRHALGKPVPALLRVEAVQTGNRIRVTVSDDGRGIDHEAVRRKAVSLRLVTEEDSRALTPAQVARFIFAPGFSTSEKVSAVSGRGVGMDVALVNVTKLGGRVDIESRDGLGTAFHIDMPLSAAMQPMLLVETALQTVGLPEAMVAEVTAIPVEAIQPVNGQPSTLLHGRFLPIFGLADIMGLPAGSEPSAPFLSLVVCEWEGRRIGLSVRRILRRHEMLIRETHPRVARLPGIGGVTTLGFDRIVLVADPAGVFDLALREGRRGLETAPSRRAGAGVRGYGP